MRLTSISRISAVVRTVGGMTANLSLLNPEEFASPFHDRTCNTAKRLPSTLHLDGLSASRRSAVRRSRDCGRMTRYPEVRIFGGQVDEKRVNHRCGSLLSGVPSYPTIST